MVALAVLAVLPLGIGLDHTKQHAVAAASECGLAGGDACVSHQGDMTVHSCASTPGSVTLGAVNIDTQGEVYKCLACARANTRACECTHEELTTPLPGVDHNPCWKGITHWCLYEPQYVVAKDDDGLYYCRHNATNTPEEKDCGLEGREACLDAAGSYSCKSPVDKNGVSVTITAVQDMPDEPTSTFMCEACGKTGMPACMCASMPAGTCGSKPGTEYHCESGKNVLMAHGRVYCA